MAKQLGKYTILRTLGQGAMGEVYLAHHPAILRVIQTVASNARTYHKSVSVCGEMASDPAMALLLIGLGVRTLSLQTSALQPVCASLQKQSLAAIETFAREALQMTRAEQVLDLLKRIQITAD